MRPWHRANSLPLLKNLYIYVIVTRARDACFLHTCLHPRLHLQLHCYCSIYFQHYDFSFQKYPLLFQALDRYAYVSIRREKTASVGLEYVATNADHNARSYAALYRRSERRFRHFRAANNA